MIKYSEETQFALLNQKLDYLTERVSRLEKVIYGIISVAGFALLGAILKLVLVK